jgi:hypothetical protein
MSAPYDKYSWHEANDLCEEANDLLCEASRKLHAAEALYGLDPKKNDAPRKVHEVAKSIRHARNDLFTLVTT